MLCRFNIFDISVSIQDLGAIFVEIIMQNLTNSDNIFGSGYSRLYWYWTSTKHHPPTNSIYQPTNAAACCISTCSWRSVFHNAYTLDTSSNSLPSGYWSQHQYICVHSLWCNQSNPRFLNILFCNSLLVLPDEESAFSGHVFHTYDSPSEIV